MDDQRGELQAVSDDEYPCDHSTVTVMMSPEEAMRRYRPKLTAHERTEIYQYPEVYYVGAHSDNSQRFGFGDVHDYYNPDDHLAFRYQVCCIFCQRDGVLVLRAYDHKNKYHVAIKVYTKPNDASETEIRILEHLREKDHDNRMNVVHIIDHFQFRTHTCIILELHRETVDCILRKNREGVGMDLVHCICRKLVQFLNGLYNNYIVHGDLKPENVLLSNTPPYIKVIDFGMARFEYELSCSLHIQSLRYRAPEVILGITYSLPVDMWSLGCILCELFTGSPPFLGDDEFDQLALIVEVLGLPPFSDILMSTRYKHRIDESGTRLVYRDGDKKQRGPPKSKNLKTILNKCEDDKDFLDFVGRCLEVDWKKRMTPSEALQHDWMQRIYKAEHVSSGNESCLPDLLRQNLLASTNGSDIKMPDELTDSSCSTPVDHVDIYSSSESIISMTVIENSASTDETETDEPMMKSRKSKGKFMVSTSGTITSKPTLKRFTASFSGIVVTEAIQQENTTSSSKIPKKNTARSTEHTAPTKKLRRYKRIVEKNTAFTGGITRKKPTQQDRRTTTGGITTKKPMQQDRRTTTGEIIRKKHIQQDRRTTTGGITIKKPMQQDRRTTTGEIIRKKHIQQDRRTTTGEITRKKHIQQDRRTTTGGITIKKPMQQDRRTTTGEIIRKKHIQQDRRTTTGGITIKKPMQQDRRTTTGEIIRKKHIQQDRRTTTGEITRKKPIQQDGRTTTGGITRKKPIHQDRRTTTDGIARKKPIHQERRTTTDGISRKKPIRQDRRTTTDGITRKKPIQQDRRTTTDGITRKKPIQQDRRTTTGGIPMTKPTRQENIISAKRRMKPKKKTVCATEDTASSSKIKLTKSDAQSIATTSGIIMTKLIQQLEGAACSSRIIIEHHNTVFSSGSSTTSENL